MRTRIFAMCGAAASLVACSQAGDENNKQQPAAPKKEKIPYCFFKPSETKAWAASRGKDGNIIVKGKAYREDARYKAVLGEPKVSGATAEVRPSIAINDTGFAAEADWWDASYTIPGSAAVDTVNVKCGAGTLAELKVPVRSK
jgi:hypothetical protein